MTTLSAEDELIAEVDKIAGQCRELITRVRKIPAADRAAIAADLFRMADRMEDTRSRLGGRLDQQILDRLTHVAGKYRETGNELAAEPVTG